MKTTALFTLLAALLFNGCMSVLKSSEFEGVKVDGGYTPAAVVEIAKPFWLSETEVQAATPIVPTKTRAGFSGTLSTSRTT